MTLAAHWLHLARRQILSFPVHTLAFAPFQHLYAAWVGALKSGMDSSHPPFPVPSHEGGRTIVFPLKKPPQNTHNIITKGSRPFFPFLGMTYSLGLMAHSGHLVAARLPSHRFS